MGTLATSLGDHVEHALEFGKKIREAVISLTAEHQVNETKLVKLNELKEEKSELQERRKNLPSDKLEELMKLDLEIKLLYLLPQFRWCPQSTLDSYNTQFVLPMVSKLVENKNKFEEEAMIRDDLTQEQKDAESKRLKDLLDELVTVSLGHITNVPNLIQLGRELAEGKENNLVITVAEVCEKQIEKLKLELEKREQLEIQMTELQQKINLQKGGPTKQQEQELDKLTEQQKELPDAFDDLATLESYTLQVSALAIESARVESNDRVLREQTSLAFKIAPTVDNWHRVKNLTSELEWEEAKKELVVHVLSLSTNPEDKKFMDGLVKIELLLEEGLWKEALDLFPKPSGSDQEILLLTKLWIEVEKNEPKELEQVKPHVERYVKRYFQEFKYNLVDPLLDQVQRKHPDFILEAYEKGIDFMMINLLPSQYPSLIRFLRAFRLRLVNVGKSNHWTTFLENFQKKHKSKKKLLTMVGMLNDSSWNIFLNPATKEDKKTAAVVAAAEATKNTWKKEEKRSVNLVKKEKMEGSKAPVFQKRPAKVAPGIIKQEKEKKERKAKGRIVYSEDSEAMDDEHDSEMDGFIVSDPETDMASDLSGNETEEFDE
eukprot:TRINITY_DN610_c0_g1_i2.p1 TRINITY_DN610_c0_g1~~TRINITY_DN610_c0_g1_i2.p1  ORF type:complete len:603 (+),score=270.24 TRINITY_DN610_c0_g1_i2:374-2182(+)